MIFENRWTRIGLIVVCVMLMSVNLVGVSLADHEGLYSEIQSVERHETFNLTDTHNFDINRTDIINDLNLDEISGQQVRDYEFDYVNIDSTPNDVKFDVEDVDTNYDFSVTNGSSRSFVINKSSDPYSYNVDEIEIHQSVSSIDLSMIDDLHLTTNDDFSSNASSYDGVEFVDDSIKQLDAFTIGNYTSNWFLTGDLNGTLDNINYNSTSGIGFYIKYDNDTNDWISYSNISYGREFEQIRFKLRFNIAQNLDVDELYSFDYHHDFQRTLKPPSNALGSDSTYDYTLKLNYTETLPNDNINEVDFTSDGRYMGTAQDDGYNQFYDTSDWSFETGFLSSYSNFRSGSFTHDDNWFISGGGSADNIRVIDTSDSDPSNWHHETYISNEGLNFVDCHPYDDYMGVAENNANGFSIWDISDSDPNNWNIVFDINSGYNSGRGCEYSNDGDMISVKDIDNGIFVYDVSDNDPNNWNQVANEYTSTDLDEGTWINTISGNDTYLYCPDEDNSKIVKFNTTDWTSEEITAPSESSTGNSVSPNGDYYVLGGNGVDNKIETFYIQNGVVTTSDNIASFVDADSDTSHTGQIDDIAFSPNGRYMVTASYDNTFKVWDTYSWANNEYGNNITMRKSRYFDNGSGFIAEYGIMDTDNYYGTWYDRYDLNESDVGIIEYYDVDRVGDNVYYNFSWSIRGTTFDYSSMNGDDYIIVGGASSNKLKVYDTNGDYQFSIDITWGTSVYSIDSKYDEGNNRMYGHYSSIRQGTDRYWGDFVINSDNTTSASSNSDSSNTDRFYVDISYDSDYAWVNLDSSELYINDYSTALDYDTTNFTSISKTIDWAHDSFQPNLFVAYKDIYENIGVRIYNGLGSVESYNKINTSSLVGGEYSNITYVKSIHPDDTFLLIGLHDWNGGDERSTYAIVETSRYTIVSELGVNYDNFLHDDTKMYKDVGITINKSMISIPDVKHGDNHTIIYDSSNISDVSKKIFNDIDILFTSFTEYNYYDNPSTFFFNYFNKSVGFSSGDTLSNYGDEIIFESIYGEFGYKFYLNYTYPEFRNSDTEGLITYISATNNSIGDISNYTIDSIKGDRVSSIYNGNFSKLDGFSYSINQTGLVGANTYADFSSSVNLTYYFNVYYDSPATGVFSVVTDYGFWGLFIPFVFAVGVGISTRNDNIAGFTFTFILGIMFLIGWTPAIVMFITILAFTVFMTYKVHRWK